MTIDFYEKTGCINNTKQKQMLVDKGYKLKVYNILDFPWTRSRLEPFFNGMEAIQCFNMSAPRIKASEIIPADYDKTEAMDAMVSDPFLIKRPLIHVNGQYAAGFDHPLVQILLQGKDVSEVLTCPNLKKEFFC